ncbi:oxidoreductase [Flexivirga endophytica]|uniref:Oxidoreductase n=1 Tax=Flexivirga endophytica TaxID=1849103 RepID=A0A916TKK1_9MICO|nr:oxidoreductase [Flexivirga endophytica]GHB60895.1 oxidoreductase [Flexivirga endophytica]
MPRGPFVDYLPGIPIEAGIGDPPMSGLWSGLPDRRSLDDVNINGRTIFIPGATSGIGLALALALHDKGNTVIVGGRRTELLEQIAADHPDLGTFRIDTTDPDDITTTAKAVIAQWPDLDMLIPMAGIMRAEDWTRSGFAAGAQQVVETNLLGPIRLIDAFVDHLRSRSAATILTVSSGLAFAPLKVTPTYNATKAAIHLLSESIRLQLADTSIEVVELEPPSVATDLMPGQRESTFAMPLDEFIAEVIELLETQPDATEIQVERVKFLRYGEARGDYDQVVSVLNESDPH